MSQRLKLHSLLCNILDCPEKGSDCRVYFQPPPSIYMKYPAIVYSMSRISNKFADDTVYFSKKHYSITFITFNPDDELIDKINQLPTCSFERDFTSDNLNHYVFNIIF